MVTIKEIAAKLGIAISTVSKGLNGASDISDDLRQLILDTAVEMGYTTKKMRKEEHKKLCILIENMDYEHPEDFGYDIVLGFRQMAMRENWSVSIVPVTPTLQAEEKYDSFMLRNGYSGSFILGFALHDDWMKQIEKTITPTVLFDNYVLRNPNVAYIGTDSYEGISLSVSHLVELGHKKIAFLNGSPNSMITEHRCEAFLNSMAANKLSVAEGMNEFGYYVADCAKYHVPAFLEKGATAILCASDLIALGVIRECRSMGYYVPEDISVIGFDDLPLAASLMPPLTTIRQDRVQLGKSGFATLSGLLKHLPLSKTLLRAQLIERSTTAIARERSSALTLNIQDKL